ncbi:vigilin-like [Sipha flava]|uniref:Vigilin-like n=1 Tax=Sipha flava TaxID=143950 RepID=A0A8B8GFV8_9HEMI|nr:vigilin-like [Sipha flava]
MKSVPVVSNLTSTGVVGYNSNSYTIMFPALPALKTLGNIGIKRQSAVFEKRSIVRTSTINEVFTITAENHNLDECKQYEEEKSKDVYRKIATETNVEIEVSISKNMNLTFLVRGKKVNVDQAKDKIIASFQTQQITRTINVAKEHHGKLMGKKGVVRKNIEIRTGSRIHIPSIKNTSEIINVTGTRNSTSKAIKELEEIILKLKNISEKEILIDQRHHGAMIGVKGIKVKQFQETFNVKITFPSLDEAKNNLVKIRGLKDDVDKAFQSISELAKALDESLKFPKLGAGNKVVINASKSNVAFKRRLLL